MEQEIPHLNSFIKEAPCNEDPKTLASLGALRQQMCSDEITAGLAERAKQVDEVFSKLRKANTPQQFWSALEGEHLHMTDTQTHHDLDALLRSPAGFFLKSRYMENPETDFLVKATTLIEKSKQHPAMVLVWQSKSDSWQLMHEPAFMEAFDADGTHAETQKNLADYLHTLFLAMKNEKDYKKRVDQSASIFKILDEYGVEAPMHLRSGLVAFIANEHWKLNRWSRSRGPGKGDYIAFVQVDTANPEAEEPSYYLVQYSETLPEYEMSQGFRGSAEIKRNWRLMDRSLLQQYQGQLESIIE